MVAREFQTIILAKCQECDEELLVKYLCHGQGLMILETLCILAGKVAGCSSELANLLVTLLPVILRIPPDRRDILQELDLAMTEWDNYFQDPKTTPYHAILANALMMEHLKTRYTSHMRSTTSTPDPPKSRAQTLTQELVSPPNGRNLKERREDRDSSTAGDSDGLTSISSMGSTSLQSSNVSDNYNVPNLLELELQQQSSGISSAVGSLETSLGALFDEPEFSITPGKDLMEMAKELFEVNTFQLLLLVLTILEKLCCREMSNQDASLILQTSGQLIDLVVCLSGANCPRLISEELEVECTWDVSTATAALLSILRGVFALLYAACRNSKSAKQLAKSAYIKTLVNVVEDLTSRLNFSAKHFDELTEEIEAYDFSSSDSLPDDLHSLPHWIRFQPLLCLVHSIQGLLTFLCSALHFGTLVNSSVVAFMRELLEHFSTNSGFDTTVSVISKVEELLVASCKVPEKVNAPSPAQTLRSLPRVSLCYILSNLGKVVSLIKKGKTNCRAGTGIPLQRKSQTSSVSPLVQFEGVTSEMEESSESAGDMEGERRSIDTASDEGCPVLVPVFSLLAVFRGSRTQYLSSQVLLCLAKVGVCSCLDPDVLVTSLLSRFHQQPRPLQTMILKLIPQLVLTEVDLASDAFRTKEPQPNYTTRRQRRLSKSSKASPLRSDSAGEAFSRFTGLHRGSLETTVSPSWACFSQYCALLTCENHVVALETAKSLRSFVNFGSSSLKEELFRVVILPSILRSDDRHKTIRFPFEVSSSPDPEVDHVHMPRLHPGSSGHISKDVLKVLLSFLPSLLLNENSRSLFFGCGGLNEMLSFLAVQEVQELVISVFRYLVMLEDRAQSRERSRGSTNKSTDSEGSEGRRKEDLDIATKAFLSLLQFTACLEEESSVLVKPTEEIKAFGGLPSEILDKEQSPVAGSPPGDCTPKRDDAIESLDKCGDNQELPKKDVEESSTETTVGNQQSSGNGTLSQENFNSILGNDVEDSPDLTPTARTHFLEESLAQPSAALENISLRIYVWKACLDLVVSNKLFLELLIDGNVQVYSYELLKWLLEFFQNQFTCEVVEEEKDALRDMVALFEAVLAVCIRLAYVGLWQDQAALPSIDSLLHTTERTVKFSVVLREFLGRGLCDALTKAAVKTLLPPAVHTQQEGEEEEVHSAPFYRDAGGEGNAEWSQLMIEDELETLNGGKKSLEDGYEADNEVNSDSSDDQDEKIARQRRSVRERQRNSEVREDTVFFRGLVIHPQICKFLLKLLTAVYQQESCKSARKVIVLTHAAQCLLGLVKDCEQNCKLLCEQGMLSSLLACYRDVLCSSHESLGGLQATLMDVFVSLAAQNIRAAELWELVQVFKAKSVPWGLLCGSLAQVAGKASQYPGPGYMLSFPCRLHTVESRFKPTGRRARGQRIPSKVPRKSLSRRGRSQLDSPGDASSEGATSEVSLLKAKTKSPDSPGRSRRVRNNVGQQTAESTRPRAASLRASKMHRSASLPSAMAESWDPKVVTTSLTEDSADLPSPFDIKAVNLRLQGSVPLPSSGFSIALWVRFHNIRRYMDCEAPTWKDEGRARSYSGRLAGLRAARAAAMPSDFAAARGDSLFSSGEALHLCSFGSRRSLFEVWVLPPSGCVLFRWTKSTKGGSDGYDIVRELVTRVPGLTRGWWHHLVISFAQTRQKRPPVDDMGEIEIQEHVCKIMTIVDGTESSEHNFGPALSLQEDSKCLLSGLLLGHMTLRTSRPERTSDPVGPPDGYDLGNVQVFAAPGRPSKYSPSPSNWVIDRDGAFYLFTLGPNAVTAGNLQRDLTLVPRKLNDPSKPFLVASRLWSRLSITERAVAAELSPGFLVSPHLIIPDVEMSVKEKLLLCYSPAHHSVFQQNVRIPVADERSRRILGPESSSRSSLKPGALQSEARIFLEVESLKCSSLLEAAHDVGGMTVFIYLFAKVVESSEDPQTQASGLSVVLSLQKNCEYHSRAMDEESGYELLKQILLSPQCKIGYHVLKVLMEAACDGDVFKHTSLSDIPIMLNIDSNAVVRNVDIFTHFLLNWKIWEKAKQGVLEMLLSTLEILVHCSHPHYQFNICQFQKAELVQQLLIGCQERQGEEFKEVPASISTLYVNIISHIMGSNPPDLTVLKAVCEFLIAIHSSDDTTRLHSPSRFYLAEHAFDFGRPSPYRVRYPSPHHSPALSSEPISPGKPIPTTPLSPHIPDATPVRCVSRIPAHSLPSHLDHPVLSHYGEASWAGDGSLCRAFGIDSRTRERHETITTENLEDQNNTKADTDDQAENGENEELYQSRDKLKLTDDNADLDPNHKVSSSCPSIPMNHGLTVQIPECRTWSMAPQGVSSSVDGDPILFHDNHYPEVDPIRCPSSVSPATPKTPVGSYLGPGSHPVSIDRKRMTPREWNSSVDVQEYEFINESDFSSLRSSLAHCPSSTDEYLVVDGFPGIMSTTRLYRPPEARRKVADNMAKMRLGLLKLLQKVLFNLQPEQVPAVIGGVLKAEYLLVWVSHDCENIRELVIKILCLYLQKAEPEQYSHFIRSNGYHLLANQLYDYPITMETVEACLWLLVGRQVDLQKDLAYVDTPDCSLLETVRPLGVVPLLALLENSLTTPNLFRLMVKHLCQLFIKVDDLCLQAVANGLLQTICNVISGLSRILQKQSADCRAQQWDMRDLVSSVQEFIACMVRKACSTSGDLLFQMFEDLLVVLENLEEWDHRKSRDNGTYMLYLARYLRYFAVQVALHFFQEICKEETAMGAARKTKKNTGLRLPFRVSDRSPEQSPFSPVSSWIHLSSGDDQPSLDPSLLKSSPTRANLNEQTRRFKNTVQTAVNFVIYSKTFFLQDACGPLQFYAADLQVHEVLQPAIVKGASTGLDINREFAQFVFSLMLEYLEASLDGKRSASSKLFYTSKDLIKCQMSKLLVHLLSPGQDPELSFYVLQLANHPQAKKLLYALITCNGGGKHKERLVINMPKLVTNPRLIDNQKVAAKNFMELLESCGLRVMTVGESSNPDEQANQWDQADTIGMVEWQKKRVESNRPLTQQVVSLGKQTSASAMDVTRVVVEIQDGQRQTLLKHNRDALSAEVQVRKKWRQLIERLTHERSIWYDEDFFPTSWRLDPTEGPSRVRCRLQRFHLDISDRFVMDGYKKENPRQGYTPLAYLFEDTTTSMKKNVYYIFDTLDTIRFQCHCKNITLDTKTQGVILIGESHMYFVGEGAIADTDITQILLGNKDTVSISWSNDDILEIRSRRYCLQDIGIEVFLSNGRTYLLAFDSKEDRDLVLSEFKQRRLPIIERPASEHLNSVTARWRAGTLSNFEYLTELNKMAGRTCNDLMQYPVFPFVLSDFTSEVLDLNDPKTLRDLTKPIAVQNPIMEAKYKEYYRCLKEDYEQQGESDPAAAPCHYSSHYSNSGTVLHFLVRLPPFTNMLLQYQDGNFDQPDRTFHSLATTWRLSSYQSPTDVKELIPEFFFLPEFLENFEGFDFGFRQNGVRVMDVSLPPWAKNNPRLFILIHRQALETDIVSQHLHNWIDLIFGFKQTGKDAVEALNVFHPATYFGVDINSITDPISNKALKTMIETYGQTPTQLFTYPHSPWVTRKPQALSAADTASVSSLKLDAEVASFTGTFINRFTSSFSSENTIVGSITDTLADIPRPVNTAEGLKWGSYVGSPALPAPMLAPIQGLSTPAHALVCGRDDRVHVLCTDTTLITMYQKADAAIDSERLLLSAVLSWAAMNGQLDVYHGGTSASPMLLMGTKTPDKVTRCAVSRKSLFIGSSTGALSVIPVKYNQATDCGIEVQGTRVRLYGHTQAITCLHVCHEFSVVVSAGQDGRAIIWDLNRLSYVRSLTHSNAVTAVSVSRTSGDIATVSNAVEVYDGESVGEEESDLYLWTVNGRPIAHKTCEITINCLDFSRAPEGLSVNVIATGLSNGAIRLWSTWDLQHIRDIAPEHHLHPITAVAFSEDSQRLFALNMHAKLMVWQRRDKSYPKPPTVISFPASYCAPRAPARDNRSNTDN
ncbi:lysosomal-trafficking regulator isoform X2 [Nematostella vectensis]|nr:lysosomal-trafficking regulator isoform X2 [Nematostella vectensis]